MCVLCGEAVDKYGRVLQVEKKYEILAEKRKRSERKSSVEGSENGWEKKNWENLKRRICGKIEKIAESEVAIGVLKTKEKNDKNERQEESGENGKRSRDLYVYYFIGFQTANPDSTSGFSGNEVLFYPSEWLQTFDFHWNL